MKIVIWGSGSGGGYWLIRVPHHPEWSDRPKNLDSYSPWMTWDGGFDRFEKFSFFAKIGQSEVKKVMKSRISLYKLQWETIRKSWDFGTFFTSDRPNITKNENFSNRSKIPERYIHEVSNALPHAFQDHLSEKWRTFHFIDPPWGTSYNNHLHFNPM